MATTLGSEEQGSFAGITVHCGRLTPDEMAALVQGADLCVDATHPYAVDATRNIRTACRTAGVEYHRLLRAQSPLPAGSMVFQSAAHVADFLVQTQGNVLLATGAKELPAFAQLAPERLYPRVLPTLDGIAACEAAHIPHKNILALQGPFSYALNRALLEQFSIRFLVTKDGGAAGGFAEKAQAAADTGIGAMVANAASALGMEVYGYDPYISIDAAWNLSRTIKHIKSLDEIYSQCDYITIHVPLLDSTKEMINKEALDKMKDGVVLLNFARDLLVDEDALIEALDSGKVKKYVTDFANHTVAGHKGILVTPHLGASTEESEENCAVMAVKEVRDFLENGNIKNSVNFPNCDMGTCVAVGRIAICHKNIPNMISQFTKILGAEGLNIADMTNKSKGEYAYTLIDLESAASREALDELKAIEGVSRVRVVK